MRLKIHQNGVGTQAAICIIGNMHQASLVTCYATIWFIIITVSVFDSMDEFIFNKGVLLNISIIYKRYIVKHSMKLE